MADELWTIHVLKLKDKNRRIEVKSSSTSDKIIKKIAKLISEDTKPEDVQFVFGDETLVYGSKKSLKDLKMVDGSSVVPVVRVVGGSLQPLPGYITVTSSKEDVDMISLDNDTTQKRAKMPCGHTIGRESMTNYCRSILSQGKSKFTCPECDAQWPYFLVRHVACLTGDEMRKFEKKLADNHLAMANGIIECPGCHSYCFRNSQNIVRVRCTICATSSPPRPDFCWYCLRAWRGDGGNRCGNSDCDGTDKRIKILAFCPTKKIRDLEVPSIRGCPKCGTLIEHVDKCKHMACKCMHEFCFSCLKPKNGGAWVCSTYGNECGLAPRQITLPGC